MRRSAALTASLMVCGACSSSPGGWDVATQDVVSNDVPPVDGDATMFDLGIGDTFPDVIAVDAPTPDASGDSGDAGPCPSGSTLVVVSGSCGTGGSVPDGLVPRLQAAQVADTVTNVAIATTTPCLPTVVCTPNDAPTLLFSDDPESPAMDGVLYADTIGPGRVRVYVYHANGDTAARKVDVVVLNQGATDAHVTMTARGLGVPSTNYKRVGQQVATDWIQPFAPRTVLVPAGTRVLLDPDLDAAQATPNQLVHAIYDLTLDARVKISVVTVAPTTDATVATATLPLLANDGIHARGTFPHADRTLVMSFDGTGLRAVRLGDVPIDAPLVGTDATGSGPPVTLDGNYGVSYTLRASSTGNVAWLVVPRGGSWAGALSLVNSVDAAQRVALPTAFSAVIVGDAVILGHSSVATGFTAGLITAGGSSLPVDLLAVPLP